ncbi:MAG: malonyl-[acyl-carrier protein] O-methyltransferase BioC, partial [Pseudomonadales bacterium]|nr:malonyl-[acyl-carrier protein] O-methyltransferase BioC [Pseudomonadales bacterium]
VEHYQDLKALTYALKAMGAHNVTPGRAKQLTGKDKIRQLKECYEGFRGPEGLPATWEVGFGVLQK